VRRNMNKPFKFKERVIVSKKYNEWPGWGLVPKVRTGRVWVKDDGSKNYVSIRFDADIGGHDINDPGDGPRCVYGHGWNVPREYVRRAPKKS
jgi:hypothetical protein